MSKLPKIDRQREHQANERTFLAWLRTSIALIGFGFALTRFGIFLQQLELSLRTESSNHDSFLNSENLGILLVILGILVIIVALLNYNRTYWQIERGNFQPNRLLVTITAILVMIVGILSLTLMIRRNPLPTFKPSSQEQNLD
jgi:putative membrane protein